MRYDETVLFSDLDGTLFNSRGEVTAENVAAIREYMSLGGRFAISTGRQPDNALQYWPDTVTNAPSVVLNGAAVYDFTAGTYDHTFYMDRDGLDPVLTEVLSAVPEADVQIYTLEGIRYLTPESRANRQFLGLHRPCAFSSMDAERGKGVFKCMFYAPPHREAAMRTILERGAGETYRIVPGTTDVGGVITYYELLPFAVSKGTAIDALRDHPDLRGRTFLAAGDYWNDYELLRHADVAVAPANAIEEIKAVSRFVTADNNHHVMARIIYDIIPAL